jgi:hypothetical protein
MTNDILIRQIQGLVIPGTGAPTAAPTLPRAIYVDETGVAGSILYVWDGTSWTAFA